MIKYLISFLFVFSFVHGISQNIITLKSENADCFNAILIKDSVFETTNSPLGFGSKMEIQGSKTSLYKFEKEHNTVWYKIIPETSCKLSLDIIPQSLDDDYDFILYKSSGGDFCNQLLNKEIKPLRTNISRNDKQIDSKTGLSDNGKSAFVKSGPGNSYSLPLDVVAGEIYYLILDNVYENGQSHTIHLHYSNCKQDKISYELEELTTDENNIKININVIDKKTKELLNADIEVKGLYSKEEDEAIFLSKNKSSCFFSSPKNEKFELTVKAPGYFNQSQRFNSRTDEEIINFNIELEKIEAGGKLIINELYFHGASAEFLSESYPALRNLFLIMKDNPSLKIEIQGHVNHPYNAVAPRSEEYLQRLSESRAEAVYKYLETRGIEPSRMKHKGFSNKQMIYPYAISEEEQKQNRRVEIIVLEI
ncbi:MAG: OmpA family protein [Saprospiraceae bacterium]|nr:OmpA family protein [Saprospiraceae bacterium]